MGSNGRIVQDSYVQEKIVINWHFNGCIENIKQGYEKVNDGFGFGDQNEAKEGILDFVVAFDLL